MATKTDGTKVYLRYGHLTNDGYENPPNDEVGATPQAILTDRWPRKRVKHKAGDLAILGSDGHAHVPGTRVQQKTGHHRWLRKPQSVVESYWPSNDGYEKHFEDGTRRSCKISGHLMMATRTGTSHVLAIFDGYENCSYRLVSWVTLTV